MAYPVAAVSLPATLAGQTNGKLADPLLVVPGFPGRANGRLHVQTARAWTALVAEVAHRFAETLTITSVPDAYRSYVVQEATFRSRYTTTELRGRPTKQWNGSTWWQKPGTAMAAVPGTSNHGWGLAVDACLWRNNAIVGITANGLLFSWLLANADRYGFSWEAQSEPWHLRYVAGDRTPQAVLDFEAPPAPTHPLPGPFPTGGDVFAGIFDCTHNGGAGIKYEIFTGGKKLWISDQGMFDGAKTLCAINGLSTEVQHIDDPGFFAAMGRVEGPNDPTCDEYGVKVR